MKTEAYVGFSSSNRLNPTVGLEEYVVFVYIYLLCYLSYSNLLQLGIPVYSRNFS